MVLPSPKKFVQIYPLSVLKRKVVVLVKLSEETLPSEITDTQNCVAKKFCDNLANVPKVLKQRFMIYFSS